MTLTATMSSMTVRVSRKIRSWVANLGPDHGQRPEHEGGVGADHEPPCPAGFTTGCQRDVDQRRDDEAADRGEHGDGGTPWLGELADGELAPDLQADDEEEQAPSDRRSPSAPGPSTAPSRRTTRLPGWSRGLGRTPTTPSWPTAVRPAVAARSNPALPASVLRNLRVGPESWATREQPRRRLGRAACGAGTLHSAGPPSCGPCVSVEVITNQIISMLRSSQPDVTRPCLTSCPR